MLLTCLEPQRTYSTPKETKSAKLEIKGYGLLGNWRLKRMLRDVELAGKKPEFFTPTFIEDSALLLTSRVKEDGYLTPVIRVGLELAGGEKLRVDSNELRENPLSPELKSTAVTFSIEKGVLFHYRRLAVEGLTVLKQKEAVSYFIETEGLLNTKGMRVFTTQRLRQGLSSLTDALERRGYAQAQATVAHEEMDPTSGAVDIRIQVQEGPKFQVRSVREETQYSGATNSIVSQVFSGPKPYSRFWVQDFTVQLKNAQYRKGYPDVTVNLKPDQGQTNADQVLLDMVATVNTGNQVRIGQVVFQGLKRTNPGFMSRSACTRSMRDA
jgi:outer membrane protein assembly factor BamA